jgi:hypothetical protein
MAEKPIDNIFIFTDADLDGACCYSVFRWYTKLICPYKSCTEKTFRKDFENFLKNNKAESFKKIYIFDLSILNKNEDIADLPNLTYINHGEDDPDDIKKFKNAKIITENSSSCALMLYKRLKDKYGDILTEQQKLLISLVNDYDSYNLKHPLSKDLNFLFWSYQGDRIEKFYNDFKNGFTVFTQQHKNLIKFYKENLNKVLEGLTVFKTNTEYKNLNYKVVSTFTNTAPSEVAHYILEKHNGDIAIVVNLNTKYISLRKDKNKNDNLHIGNFTKTNFKGGGTKNIGGGFINEEFLTFSKKLEACK